MNGNIEFDLLLGMSVNTVLNFYLLKWFGILRNSNNLILKLSKSRITKHNIAFNSIKNNRVVE
jgi:hypothetical protein